MKKGIILFAAILLFGVITKFSMGQTPPPPPPPPQGGHGSSGNQPQGGAPVGNGTGLLIALSLFYAGKKVYSLRSESNSI
jgi:hypothetical protein